MLPLADQIKPFFLTSLLQATNVGLSPTGSHLGGKGTLRALPWNRQAQSETELDPHKCRYFDLSQQSSLSLFAGVVSKTGLRRDAGPGGMSQPRGCWAWCVVPLPTEMLFGGLGVHPVSLTPTGAPQGLASGDESGVYGKRACPFIFSARVIIKQQS